LKRIVGILADGTCDASVSLLNIGFLRWLATILAAGAVAIADTYGSGARDAAVSYQPVPQGRWFRKTAWLARFSVVSLGSYGNTQCHLSGGGAAQAM